MPDEDLAAPAAAAVPADPSPRDLLIERWFREHFHGSVVSQHTEAFNHVRRGVDALKKLLAGL